MAILIEDKINFKSKTSIGDKGLYIMIKRLILREDMAVIHIYAPSIRVPKI